MIANTIATTGSMMILKQLKQQSLGESGIAFLSDKLKGTGMIGKLPDLLLEEGLCFAVVPQAISAERARQFDVGGLMDMSEGQNWLASHALSVLSRRQEGTLIFQDVWGARSYDPGVRTKTSKMFFNQSDVYYFVEAKNANEHSILAAMREIRGFLLVGVFTEKQVVADQLPADGLVADDFIDAITRMTSEIYLSAYDQESFVVWKR